MKKNLFSAIILIFLLFSCEQSDYNYYFRIINNSSETMSFNFNGSSESVPANTTVELEKAHYTALADISGGGYPIKIKMSKMYTDNCSFITYTFDDVIPYKLSVVNTLPLSVIIKAGDYIDNNGSAELTVSANDEVSNINIYTNTPKFLIVSPNYPISIDWIFNNDTVYVTLR